MNTWAKVSQDIAAKPGNLVYYLGQLSSTTTTRTAQFSRAIAQYLTQRRISYKGEIIESAVPWAEFKRMYGVDGIPDVDVMARTDGGHWIAVQCKCYSPSSSISRHDIDQFISATGGPVPGASNDTWYGRMIVATVDIHIQTDQPVKMIGYTELLVSSHQWPAEPLAATPVQQSVSQEPVARTLRSYSGIGSDGTDTYLVRLPAQLKTDALEASKAQGVSLNLVIQAKLAEWLADPHGSLLAHTAAANTTRPTPWIQNASQLIQQRPDYQACINRLSGKTK